MNRFALLVAVVFLASCGTARKAQSVKTLGIYGPGVIQNPVIADLDVKQNKVSGTATGASNSMELIKNLALSDAIRSSGADVLVEPTFEIEATQGKIRAIVTGYPRKLHELPKCYGCRFGFGQGRLYASCKYGGH